MEQLKNESETELQNQSEIEMQNQSEAEMPRGDKTSIMQYDVPKFEINIQKRIPIIY